MPSEEDFVLMGVAFKTSSDPSDPLYASPSVGAMGRDEAAKRRKLAEVFAEIAVRAALLLPLMRAHPTGTRWRITDAPEPRCGACTCCGDAIEAHVSRVCQLCFGAMRAARRQLAKEAP